MTSEEIIKIYKDKYGYVTDIKDLISFLKESPITHEEMNKILFDILKWNLQVDLDNKKSYEDVQKRVGTIINEEKQEKEKEEVESDVIDVLSYVNSLKECDDEDFITELLPSIYDGNYDSIISAILLYLLREIQIAHEMMSDEDKSYLMELISVNKRLIQIIEEYNQEESEELEQTNIQGHKNKLVFLSKGTDSYYIHDDIDEVLSCEEDILPTISDLENGRITREKRYRSNKLKGISAIRKRDSRIFFARLDNDVMVILGAMIKRCQNTQEFRDFIEARAKAFRLQKDELKEAIKNEEFMNKHESILEEIKQAIRTQFKELKVGDNNG